MSLTLNHFTGGEAIHYVMKLRKFTIDLDFTFNLRYI